MKILIGTTSEQKINIIKKFLVSRNLTDAEIKPFGVESGIADQPLDEKTTIQGSITRAMNAVKANGEGDFDFSLGLEAGLEEINGIYHIVCTASIVDEDNNIYTGVSKKLPLPTEVSSEVKKGGEFGVIIREFDAKTNGKPEEIESLVKELINRTDGFSEAFGIAFLKYGNRDFFKQKRDVSIP